VKTATKEKDGRAPGKVEYDLSPIQKKKKAIGQAGSGQNTDKEARDRKPEEE